MFKLTYPYFRYQLSGLGDAIVLYKYTTDSQDGDPVADTELDGNSTIAFGANIPISPTIIADAGAGNDTYYLEAGIDGDFTIASSSGGADTIILSQDIDIESITESSNTLSITVNNGGNTHTVTITDADRYIYQIGDVDNLTLQDIIDDYGDGYLGREVTRLNPEHNILSVTDLVTSRLPITDDNENDANYTLLTALEGGNLSLAGVSLEVGDSISYQDVEEGLVVLTITDADIFTGFNLRLSDSDDAVAFNFVPNLRYAFTPLDTDDGNTVDRSVVTEAELITTGDNDDTIAAGRGDDVIEAGRGDDTINLNDSLDVNNGGADEVVYRVNSTNSVAFDGGDKLNDFRLGQDILTLEIHNYDADTIAEYLASPDFAVSFVYAVDENDVFTITGLNFHFRSSGYDGNYGITKSYFALSFAEGMMPSDFISAVEKDGNLNIDIGSRSIIDLSVLPNLFKNDTLRIEPVYIVAMNIDDGLDDVNFTFFESTRDNNITIPLTTLSLSDGSDINEYTVSVTTEVKEQDGENLNNDDDFGYDVSNNTLFLQLDRISAYGNVGNNLIDSVDVTITLSKAGAPDLVLVRKVNVDTTDVAPYFAAEQEYLELEEGVDFTSGTPANLGTIEALDVNSADHITYSIIEVAIDGNAVADPIKNAFSIGENTGVVRYNGTELKADDGTYSITFRATSSGGEPNKTADITVDITFDTAPEIALTAPSGDIVEAGINEIGTAETVNNGALTITDSTDLLSDIELYARAGDNSGVGFDNPTNSADDNDSVKIDLNGDTKITGTYGEFTFTRDNDGVITSWKYTLNDNDSDTIALRTGDTRIDTVKVIAYDDYGFASDVVNAGVNIKGANDSVGLSFGGGLDNIKIDENATGVHDVSGGVFAPIYVDNINVDPITKADLTVYEGDFVSSRFSIDTATNSGEFKIVFTGDGDNLDYELESFVDINIQVRDDRDAINDNIYLTPHIVRVYVNDVTGDVENTPPYDDTRPFINTLVANDYTSVNVFTEDDKSGETTDVGYLLIGTSEDDTIHASKNADVVIGNDGNDTLNPGDGSDVIIIEFDSANKVFTSGIDHIDNFNIGEDTLLLSDTAADGINSLSAFIDLFTGNTHDSGIRVQFHVEDDLVTGVQLRSNDTSDRVNVYFSHSDRFDADDDGIIGALGIPVADLPEGETIDFSEYYDSDTHRLQEKAFTATYIQNLFGVGDSAAGLRVTEKATITNKFATADAANNIPVLSASYTTKDITQDATVTSTFTDDDTWFDDTFSVARLYDGEKKNGYGNTFDPTSADGDSVTFTFDQEYMIEEFALYNTTTTLDREAERIDGSYVQFYLQGQAISGHYTLYKSNETNNYVSPLNDHDNNVIVIAPLEDLVFDAVKLTFHGKYQHIREVEIYAVNASINENADGDVNGLEINVSDADAGTTFTATDFTIYEANGEESTRFELESSGSNNKYKLKLKSGEGIDYELENSVQLSIIVNDGIDLSSVLEVTVQINDLTGASDSTLSLHETLTNDFANGDFTRLAVSDLAVNYSSETNTRYLFVGDSGANDIHGSGTNPALSGYDDVLIGNDNGDGDNDRDILNSGDGDDVIIVQFDSSTGLFLSGSDNITNFNLGEDTLLIADNGGMNSLSQFLILFVENGHGVRATLLLNDDDTMVEGIQLRAINDHGDDRVNIEFSTSDHFSTSDSNIRNVLGIPDDADLSDYYDTENHHLQDAAFTVERFRNLFSDSDAKNGLLITDIQNLPAEFGVDAENHAPVLSLERDDDIIPNITRIYNKVTVDEDFNSQHTTWADGTSDTTEHIYRLVDGNTDINPSNYNEHFAPVGDVDNRSVTFTFGEQLRGIILAIYNTNESQYEDYILGRPNQTGALVKFIQNGESFDLEYDVVLHKNDQVNNYATPDGRYNSAEAHNAQDQDRVIVITPDPDTYYDSVEIEFGSEHQYFLREVEIYGLSDQLVGYIDEGTTGEVGAVKISLSDEDNDSIDADDFTVFEADGSESTRFDIISSGVDYKLSVTDGAAVDYEYESTIHLSVQVYDGVDFSDELDVEVRVNNLNGDDDITPIPTSGFDISDFSVHHANNDFTGNDAKSYLVYGDDDNNNIVTDDSNGDHNDIIIGSDGEDSLNGYGGNDIFVFRYDSSTSRFASGTATQFETTNIYNFTVGEDKILLADARPGFGMSSLEDLLPQFTEGSGQGIALKLITHGGNTVQGVTFEATGALGTHGREFISIGYDTGSVFNLSDTVLKEKLAVPDGEDLDDYLNTNGHILKTPAHTIEVLENLLGVGGIYVNDIDNISDDITQYL